ncbi:unnamed protein product, partial [Rotaria sp. Silwood1]
ALRDGVAQTMTLFKPRLVTVHRPTCLFHQQQLAAAGTSKQSPDTDKSPIDVEFCCCCFKETVDDVRRDLSFAPFKNPSS